MSERADRIRVQKAAFNEGELYQWLIQGDHQQGAVVNFIGRVRSGRTGVTALFLEHYPAMTLPALKRIVADARKRWPLGRVVVVHRIGEIAVGHAIVYVGVSSEQRRTAFNGCAFIMDMLKTQAPLWKKERTATTEYWLEAKARDQLEAQRWLQD